MEDRCMQRKFKVYIAFTLIIGAMGFLLISGFDRETMTYYATVKELKSKGTEAYVQGYRVSGVVVRGSLEKSADQLQVRFDIREEGEVLSVVYDGILPDTFKEDGEVLIEGKYKSDGIFYATNIMTKCASKYDPESKVSSGQ
jgi:cytochrome c-type biogenesis protein CcmE